MDAHAPKGPREGGEVGGSAGQKLLSVSRHLHAQGNHTPAAPLVDHGVPEATLGRLSGVALWHAAGAERGGTCES